MDKHSLKVGISFGLTSGIITTLGLMVGLNASTHSKMVVIGGILTIAIADALSDALGIHVSEESENQHNAKEIWQSTIATFLTKFLVALTFLIPVLVFTLNVAMIVSIIWGLTLLSSLSYYIGKQQGNKEFAVILEHLLIAVIVIVLTHYVGLWINSVFS